MIARTLVVAEAGVNHNGDPDLAHRLVEAAARAGVDAIKFQTFQTDRVVRVTAPKADYQRLGAGANETQYEMLRRLELPRAAYAGLKAQCDQLGIEFLSTPFDADSADFLVHEIGVKRLKSPSGEITNAPLLLHMARLNVPIIQSTGMSTLPEVREALAILAHGYVNEHGVDPSGLPDAAAFASPAGQAALREKVTLLHCTSSYPTPYASVNLRAMDTLAKRFGLTVGLSDHSPGIVVPIAAAARGAAIIEKHFTLDRDLPGPDHQASLEPDELSLMVTAIRTVELSLGNGTKVPSNEEAENLIAIRRALVAARPIRAGEPFSIENLTAKRPAVGLPPGAIWQLVGRPAPRAFAADEPVEI